MLPRLIFIDRRTGLTLFIALVLLFIFGRAGLQGALAAAGDRVSPRSASVAEEQPVWEANGPRKLSSP